MYEMPYRTVVVAINGELSQEYRVRDCDVWSFAADRALHYAAQLGKYLGTIVLGNELDGPATHDRFERGFIYVEAAKTN